jgi:hypothetical protein
MRKVNTKDIEESLWESPKGKYRGGGKHISIALGRDSFSTDVRKRHAFDVEICRIPPGKANCPYHSHSAQWEFYHVFPEEVWPGIRVEQAASKLATRFCSSRVSRIKSLTMALTIFSI